MTVVVGFIGPDGAVMASDSEATEGDQTRRETDKIWPCGALLMGYTGTGSVRQPLQLAVTSAVEQAEGDGRTGRWDVRAAIGEAAALVLEGAYANHVPRAAPGEVPKELRGILMTIGRDGDGFWLLEQDHNNQLSFYEHIGFHAIGSGSVAAQIARGLLAHYEPIGRSLPHLRLIAYRTVATCIGVLGAGYGVGGHVRLWHAEGDAGFTELDDAELARVENGVEQWTTIEAESLDRVVLEDAAAPEPEGEELPEELDPHGEPGEGGEQQEQQEGASR